jgi:hypothetical protein
MAKNKDVYIQCIGDHGIKVKSEDGKLTKRFDIQAFDGVTGRVVRTGYTKLSLDEYETLLKQSSLFAHFIQRGVLVKHDKLPDDAVTAHDALVGAKREAAESAERIDALEKEVDALKAENDTLKAENAELKKGGGSGGEGGSGGGTSF